MFHYPGLLSMRPTVSGDMTHYLRVCVCVRARACMCTRASPPQSSGTETLVRTTESSRGLCTRAGQRYASHMHNGRTSSCSLADKQVAIGAHFRQPRGGGRVRNRKATTTQLATVQCVRRHCTRTARSEPICAHGWCECHQTESIPCADFKLGARAARQDRVF